MLLAAGAMRDRKVRAALTIIGIVIGPASIVALVGATQGFSNASAAQFQKLGATTIFESGSTNMTQADVDAIGSLQGVAAVVPYVQMSGQIDEAGSPTGVQVIATDIAQLSKVMPALALQQGSVPPGSDATGAVVGYSVARPGTQGATNLTLDDVLTVSGMSVQSASVQIGGGLFFSSKVAGPAQPSVTRSFIVSGIYSPFGQGFLINPDSTVFVPLSVAQAVTHSYTYNSLLIAASSPGEVSQVLSEVKSLFPKVNVNTASSVLGIQQSISQSIGTLLESVAGVSVLVAFIGIMTTMFTSVLERTKEIGIIKALGASGGSIMLTFLSEALLVGLVGGLAGAGAGTALSFLVVVLLQGSSGTPGLGSGPRFEGPPNSIGSTSGATAITPAVSPELLLGAIALATVVGVLAGIYPAWRASKLSPVEALRSL